MCASSSRCCTRWSKPATPCSSSSIISRSSRPRLGSSISAPKAATPAAISLPPAPRKTSPPAMGATLDSICGPISRAVPRGAGARDKSDVSKLAHAFDDEGTAGRVGEPGRQYFLVFRRIVPALHRRDVGEFEDDHPFRLRSAFGQFGSTAPGQVAAAILCDGGGNRRPIGLVPGGVGNVDFGDEIGRHVCLLLLTCRNLRLKA